LQEIETRETKIISVTDIRKQITHRTSLITNNKKNSLFLLQLPVTAKEGRSHFTATLI
jgi:hypothetical protein